MRWHTSTAVALSVASSIFLWVREMDARFETARNSRAGLLERTRAAQELDAFHRKPLQRELLSKLVPFEWDGRTSIAINILGKIGDDEALTELERAWAAPHRCSGQTLAELNDAINELESRLHSHPPLP
jgi:hypothetical protein